MFNKKSDNKKLSFVNLSKNMCNLISIETTKFSSEKLFFIKMQFCTLFKLSSTYVDIITNY